MSNLGYRQPNWLQDLPQTKPTMRWATKPKVQGEVTVSFRCRGEMHGPYSYEELRALREQAIAQKDHVLSGVIKGLLHEVSGRWIETSDGKLLRSGNRCAKLGASYGQNAIAKAEATAKAKATRERNKAEAPVRAAAKAAEEARKGRALTVAPAGSVRLSATVVKRG